MPKKFKGENSKAVEAKLRKNAVKEAEDEKKKQHEEDESWKDEDKNVMKKQQRKENKDKKKHEMTERKLQLKELYTDEMTSIKSNNHPEPAPKVTRAQIELTAEKQDVIAEKQKTIKEETPIEENVNRLVVEGDEARNVEEAISILSINDEKIDRHPEKRMKAAYLAFEEESLAQLKIENPSMRLSQLKQMVRKEWSKSPLNPLNQQ